MALNAELAVRLDANTLVQGFLSTIGGSAASLGGITAPANADQLGAATSSGGSFLGGPILEAVGRFALAELPVTELPGTVQRIESALQSIERLTTRDVGADLATLMQQIASELERSSPQGVVGVVLRVSELLRGSPAYSALAGLLHTFAAGSSSLGAPAGVAEYLPALAAAVRVVSGLMIYESVLSEGERLTGLVSGLFSAEHSRAAVDALERALLVGERTLADVLAEVSPGDTARVDALSDGLENAAALLEQLDASVSESMGFGEATLVHFDVAAAQAEISAAGALLRDPDLGALRRAVESLAQLAQPLLELLDPRDAAARGMEAVLGLAEARVAETAAGIRSFDAGVLVTPLTDGISAITTPLSGFTEVVTQLVAEVRAVLEQVRAAIAALPIADLANAIRTALQPVTQALDFLRGLVERIQEALEVAADAALEVLSGIEGQVDAFRAEIMGVFAQARQFVDELHLDQVVAGISDKVNEFVGLLQQAQLKPYFDTASSAIGAAADVISQVPLDLLPSSMKADLDAALAPVREVDARAVEAKIESLLQISADGKFELRGDLEAALAGVQAKFDELLGILDQHHPRKYLEQIDRELASVAAKIRDLTPQLTLEPVQRAIDELKSALGSFDLERELRPVQRVFDQALAGLDEYSPVRLLEPLAARVTEARQLVKRTVRIDSWRPALDSLSSLSATRLDALDPVALEQLLTRLFETLAGQLEQLPDLGLKSWLGTLLAGLMRSSSARIAASSFETVAIWLEEGGAAAHLTARATKISDAVQATRTQIEAFDPTQLSGLVGKAEAARARASALAVRVGADSPRGVRLSAAAARLDAGALLSRLAANRTHYLTTLSAASALGETLRRTGMSEADVAVQQLRQPFVPLRPLLNKLYVLGTYLGIVGTDGGLASVLKSIFAVATPARLVGIVVPLIAAFRDRLRTLIDQVLTPVRTAVDELTRLIDLIDLQPVLAGVKAVFDEVRADLLAFSPSVLLREELVAFAELKQTVLEFDPLAVVLRLLDALRDTAARLVLKLSAQALLESPLAIYDTISGVLHQLNIETLLAPVLDELDNIALQVDQGLDETVEAFERLQESLPAPGGGSSVSASVEVN